MKAEELGHIRLDWKYVFHLKDGRNITKFGSWLLSTAGGCYSVDEDKCALIESVDLYEEES